MEQYQYKQCGLDYVYLTNGFHRVRTADDDEVVVIDDVLDLHRAIRESVIESPLSLTPSEFRFLRREIDLSQRRLASALGVEEQTISAWERGKTDIPHSAELILRAWVKECDSDRPALKELTERLNELDRWAYEREKNNLEFSRDGSTWVQKAAA